MVKSQPDMNIIATSSMEMRTVLKDGFTVDMGCPVNDCLVFL
jgi:hypothetical protein